MLGTTERRHVHAHTDTDTDTHTHGEREEKESFIGDFSSHLCMAVNFQSYKLLIRLRMEFQQAFYCVCSLEVL